MNDLNQRLATLADEMTDTDYSALRQRVDTSARRLGYRRTAATSLAALALAGVATIGGIQLLPSSDAAPQPGESVTTVAPPSTAPSTAPTPPATSAPATQNGAGVTAPDRVPGRLVYLRFAGEIEVVTVTDGVTRTTSFGHRTLGDQVATVSPDGSKVALVRPKKEIAEYPGDLIVRSPGGAEKVVARDVSWGGGSGPTWTADSKRLLVGITPMQGDAATGEQRFGYVDAASGAFSELDVDGFPEYLAWSGNGAFRAHAELGTKIVVARAGGDVVRRFDIAGQPECDRAACPFAVQAVSNDGRYVATAMGNTDPSRVKRATVVLDTTTGRRIALPSGLKGITEIFFRADNSLVVQTADKLHLVSLDGEVTATIDRPDATNEADLSFYLDR